MGALKITYTIEESANGEYFTFTDTTGDYNAVTNVNGWGAPNYARADLYPMRLVMSYSVLGVVKTSYYTFTTTAESDVIALQAGVDIAPDDVTGDTMTGTTFDDNVYAFKVQLYIDADWRDTYSTTYLTNSVTEGFASVITGISIREFLSYRIYLDYKNKDEIMEKLRLLNNLAFASSVGDTTSFSENLLLLEQIQ